jgi:LacI family transcriptional regulator
MDIVAEKAKVSRSTVSRALRNHPAISNSTKQRIKKIAAKLGYCPNPLVAALMSQLKSTNKKANASHPVIALVSSFPMKTGWQNNTSVTRMIEGAIAQAERLGFRLSTFHLAEPGMTDARLSQILYTRGIQGVIILPMTKSSSSINLNWPIFSSAALGYSLMHPKLHRVCNHLAHTIANALDNVIRLGYQRIGLAMRLDTDERVDHAWRSGYVLYREMFPSIIFTPMLLTVNWNKQSFEKWFLEHNPKAVISDDIQVLQWLREMHYNAPKNVGLVMLDYSKSYGNCAGIDQHHEILGAAAVDLVVGQLYRNETGVPLHPKYVTIEGSWVDGTTVLNHRPAVSREAL